MRTSELDYELPEELIAIEPVEPRDSARLLVVSRSDPERLEHRSVRDLPGLLSAEDLLVFNRSRVLAARFLGVREDTGGKVEGLYLAEGPEAGAWVCMLKSRRFREGARVRLFDREGGESDVALEMRGRAGDGAWVVNVAIDADGTPATLGGRGDTSSYVGTPAILDRVGLPPLPPYILAARKRRAAEGDAGADLEHYQTVYAREAGSVAAPTAGLHFTPGLLSDLDNLGIERGELVLHVGMGTFKPIEVERVEDHPMHSEWCSMDTGLGEAIRERIDGNRQGRVIAVGTTSVRTIEAYAREVGSRESWPSAIETRLMIAPGERLYWTQGLLTNFHLPRSTLLALVAAMLEEPGSERSGIKRSGIERLLAIYREAIVERYRFYSFGDAMLILP